MTIRYAHPYFDQQPQAALRARVAGLAEFSKTRLGAIPPVRSDGEITLQEIIGQSGVDEILRLGEIRFHALGDSGTGHAEDAQKVAEDMATDFNPTAGGLNPAFLFHLGDIVYGPGKAAHYDERFYSPYRHYPGKIIAIPGNHDGEVKTEVDGPSLKDFLKNFCAEQAAIAPQAGDSGTFRETMTLPGPYWYLDAPFVRIIGLYSNRLENPGYLEGLDGDGNVDNTQIEWLKTVLTKIKNDEQKKALVIATHHPPFSSSGHSGSTEMLNTIDAVLDEVQIEPHAFLSAHSHSYQRYTHRKNGKQIPFLVVGSGGASLQNVGFATGAPADSSNNTTYDAALSSLGYLFVTASATTLKLGFWRFGTEHTTAFDTVTVDIGTHTIR